LTDRLVGLPHRCAIRIHGVYPSLKTAEKRAADWLLQAGPDFRDTGIVAFAARAGCSEATVVRLARRLGYRGFTALKVDCARAEGQVPYRDIDPRDAPDVVARKVFTNGIQALSDTLALVDTDTYRRAVGALLKAERLAFFGLGNAAVVAQEAYQKFLRIGVPCHTAEDPDLQLILVNTHLRRGDVVVALSYTGESRPILALARRARARGVRVLAITNFPRSSLGKLADLTLLTAVFQEQLNGEVAAKRLAQLCIVESLYVNYLLRRGRVAWQNLAASNQALALNKRKVYAPPHTPAR
jgi:DNA-binding MurR/RpiR family transcriptional regulator